MKRRSICGRLSLVLSLCLAPAMVAGLPDCVSAQKLLLGLPQPILMQRQPVDDTLRPIPNGPGIQVCAPVAPGGDVALADFGAGCGLWLQWSMGFHPELGQTPRWESVGRASSDLHAPRLRLTLTQGAQLAGILGVTHVAVGQITGTRTQCVLTYQLYAVPSQKAVGAPIRLSGSEEQVIAALPGAARTLLTGLGVHTLHVPVDVGATAAEMTLLGHYNMAADPTTTAADQKQMEALDPKLPLAALLLFGHGPGHNAKEVETNANHLLEKGADNFLVLGVISTIAAGHSPEFVRLMDSKIAALHAPNNSVLAYWPLALAPTLAARIPAAQKIARLAPNSANAWYTLALHTAAYAQSIRRSRVFAALSAQEAETLIDLYAQWEHAAVKATTLDPFYQPAWLELATAATFASDRVRADSAFWKAYALDKGDHRVYTWGLEMYQQKWGGDPKTLAKVARLMTTNPLPPSADLYNMGLELRSAGFPDDANVMFRRAVVMARGWVAQTPKESYYHFLLGTFLNELGSLPEAETEFKTAVTLNPNSHSALLALGKFYEASQRHAEAIVQMREDLRVTAGTREQIGAKTTLAEALLNANPDGPYEEPERLLNEVLKAAQDWNRPFEDLGWLLARKKEYDAAIDMFRAAERLNPANNVPYQEIGRIYRLQSKFEEALQEGERAVALDPKSASSLSELAETYAAKGEDATSLKLYLKAVAVDPKYAQGHLGLGKLYLKMGKKDEARTELKRVLTLNANAQVKQFAQELLDKNP